MEKPALLLMGNSRSIRLSVDLIAFDLTVKAFTKATCFEGKGYIFLKDSLYI